MTLPGNNSAVLLFGRQRETHTSKPVIGLQPDLQHSPDQNETRGNPQILTGIPEGRELLQCQYPSIPLPHTGSLWKLAQNVVEEMPVPRWTRRWHLLHNSLSFLKGGKGRALNSSGSFSFQLALQLCGRWDEDSSWPAGHQPRDGDNVTIEEGRTLLLGTATSILNLLHLKGLRERGSVLFLLQGWGLSWPWSLLPSPSSRIRGDTWLCLLSANERGSDGGQGKNLIILCAEGVVYAVWGIMTIIKKGLFSPFFFPQPTKIAAVLSSVQW